MGAFKLKINNAGVQALLKSPGVRADIQRRCQQIAAAAGDGMEASVEDGPKRVRGSVITATTDARIAEATNRALTAALDAGR